MQTYVNLYDSTINQTLNGKSKSSNQILLQQQEEQNSKYSYGQSTTIDNGCHLKAGLFPNEVYELQKSFNFLGQQAKNLEKTIEFISQFLFFSGIFILKYALISRLPHSALIFTFVPLTMS